MDRLKGSLAFLVVAAVVLLAMRGVHLATPMLFPGTQQGPIALGSLDDVRPRAGFSPVVPGYHPASLGAGPSSISLLVNPTPTVILVWRRNDTYLSMTEQRGAKPGTPEGAVALEGVPDSLWWASGSEKHLVVSRLGYWIELVTNLPASDLKRFADTLTIY